MVQSDHTGRAGACADCMDEQLVQQPNLRTYHRSQHSTDTVEYSSTSTASVDSSERADCVAPTDIRQLDNAVVAQAMASQTADHQPATIDDTSELSAVNFVLYDRPAYLWQNTDPSPYLSSLHIDGGMSQILDWLYLGARSNAADGVDLQHHHITHIYNTCTESPNFFPHQYQYVNLPIDDKTSEADKLLQMLPNITEQLHQHYLHNQAASHDDHHHVLVHCVAGVSRSPTIVAAYLIRYHSMSLVQAMHTLVQSRDRIQPNEGFLYALAQFERQYHPHNKSTLPQTKRLLHRAAHCT